MVSALKFQQRFCVYNKICNVEFQGQWHCRQEFYKDGHIVRDMKVQSITKYYLLEILQEIRQLFVQNGGTIILGIYNKEVNVFMHLYRSKSNERFIFSQPLSTSTDVNNESKQKILYFVQVSVHSKLRHIISTAGGPALVFQGAKLDQGAQVHFRLPPRPI